MTDLPDWEDPRRVLARHGLRPKRGFSQNFLVSRHAVDAIVAAAELTPGGWVVELGPGLGTLTGALLRADARVYAVERDPDMVRVLQAEFGGTRLQIEHGDVTELDYGRLGSALGGDPLTVVGNLPYAVTGAVMRGLIGARSLLSRVLVMVQREVRDRLEAAPGTGEYGALSVFTSAAFEVDTVVRVPAGAFHPPPKVDSAVVRLRPRRVPLAEESAGFRAVVRAAFQSRRKTLRNALTRAADPASAAKALEHAEIDPARRGETLSVAEFDRLARALEAIERGS